MIAELSFCCGAPIIEPDICSECKEHSGPAQLNEGTTMEDAITAKVIAEYGDKVPVDKLNKLIEIERKMQAGEEPKLCRIEDPDCEACQ